MPKRPISWGIIADDLTGALDAAAPFARRGIGSRVLLNDNAAPAAAEVVALSTETRDAPRDAVDRVALSLLTLQHLGATNVFKKIDSTLRGDFGTEIVTLLDRMPLGTVALICPAHPDMGRTVVDGRLRVRDDPQALDIADYLPEPSERLVLGTPLSEPQNARFLIADAEDSSNLAVIVEWAQQSRRRVLLVGSGGLAAAIALGSPSSEDVTATDERNPVSRVMQGDPLLAVAGSRHRQTSLQISAVASHAGVAYLPLEAIEKPGDWESRALAARRASTKLVTLTAGGRLAVDPRRLESRLAEAAEAVVRAGVAGLFLTGGSTARAVLDRLGTQAVDLEGELEPGVPIGRAVAGICDSLPVITKAGGFGTANVITTVMELLYGEGHR